MTDPMVAERIRADIDAHDVVLYMKGTPVYPQCGFSAKAVNILNMLGVKFKAVDVLTDPNLRQGIKDFSDWPALPQLFIRGEFIGGSDIMREMMQSGELQKMLASRGVAFHAVQRAG